MFYYEDDSLQKVLGYDTILLFGKIEVSPPTDYDQLEGTQNMLTNLRDALKLRGLKEQIEGKARITKDSTLLQDETFLAAKEKLENDVTNVLHEKIDKIRRQKEFKKKQSEEAGEVEFNDRPTRGRGRGPSDAAAGGYEGGNRQRQ